MDLNLEAEENHELLARIANSRSRFKTFTFLCQSDVPSVEFQWCGWKAVMIPPSSENVEVELSLWRHSQFLRIWTFCTWSKMFRFDLTLSVHLRIRRRSIIFHNKMFYIVRILKNEVKISCGMYVLSLIYSYVVCTWLLYSMLSDCYLLCVFWCLLCSNYSSYIFYYLFCMFYSLFCVFFKFFIVCVFFLLMYIIISFLFVYKFTHHCYWVEIRFELINIISSYPTTHLQAER